MTDQHTLFSVERGQELAERGMQAAVSHRERLMRDVGRIARHIAADYGEVTIDDVYGWMKMCGLPESSLGPAAGSIFRDKSVWEFTGKWVRSSRVSNHARMIRVWRLRRGA